MTDERIEPLVDSDEVPLSIRCSLEAWGKHMQRSEVVSEPTILAGKPVIKGTRVSVELILEKLAAGESERQILEAHPHLAEDAVRVAFAARALQADVIYPTEAA